MTIHTIILIILLTIIYGLSTKYMLDIELTDGNKTRWKILTWTPGINTIIYLIICILAATKFKNKK